MSYRPLTSFKPRAAPQSRTTSPPRLNHHSTSSDRNHSTGNKGKQKATEQDELDWEQERGRPAPKPKLRSLNSFIPPAPTLPPQNATSSMTAKAKRTSRPSNTTAPPPPRKQARRILVTPEEQAKWDREKEELEEQNGRTRKRKKPGGTSNSADDHDSAAKSRAPTIRPLTSMIKHQHLAPPPVPPYSTKPAKESKVSTTSSTSHPPVSTPASASSSTASLHIRPLTSHSAKLFTARIDSSTTNSPVTKKKLLSTLQAPPQIKLESGISSEGGSGIVLEDDEFSFSSPEKKGKKKSYLPSGIAARANSILAAAKTDHSLWLNDVSRKLNSPLAKSEVNVSDIKNRGGASRNKEELEILLEPDLKLIIVEIIDSSARTDDLVHDGDGGGVGRGGNTQRTLLTRCRLDLSSASANLDQHSSSTQEAVDLDLTGLVLFSLHNHRSSSSSSASSSAASSFSYPQIRPKPDSDLVETTNNDHTRKRSLFIPQGPLDFKVFRPGLEVWAFSSEASRNGGFGINEVELNEDQETWKISLHPRNEEKEVKQEPKKEIETAKIEESREEDDMELDENDIREEDLRVKWAMDKRSEEEIKRGEEEKRQREKKRERVRKGLIVTKFGVLV